MSHAVLPHLGKSFVVDLACGYLVRFLVGCEGVMEFRFSASENVSKFGFPSSTFICPRSKYDKNGGLLACISCRGTISLLICYYWSTEDIDFHSRNLPPFQRNENSQPNLLIVNIFCCRRIFYGDYLIPDTCTDTIFHSFPSFLVFQSHEFPCSSALL